MLHDLPGSGGYERTNHWFFMTFPLVLLPQTAAPTSLALSVESPPSWAPIHDSPAVQDQEEEVLPPVQDQQSGCPATVKDQPLVLLVQLLL